MNFSDGMHGTLLFFRRDGQAGTPYQLSCGKTTIGSSKDADIRLKLTNTDLEWIHCIIDVNEDGIATLLNKSVTAPVKVNTISVRKLKVLKHGDKIELVGKQFQYLNENISEEDVERQQEFLKRAISTPSKKRQSVAPLMKSAKKTPSMRSKTKTMRKSFAGSSMEFEVSDAKIRDRRSIIEKSKTTSKVVVSKALGSTRPSKRRLSLGSNPKNSNRNPAVSARNILLSKHVVSSAITEKHEIVPTKPSLSMRSLDMYVDEDVEFLDESNISLECQLENSPRRIYLKTPSKSSIKITVTETTPRMTTPVNKKLEARSTPVSSKKTSTYTVSPLKRTPSLAKKDSSPRRSVLRKSLRNSRVPVNGTEEQQTSSEESICLETASPIKSKWLGQGIEREEKSSPKCFAAKKSLRRSSVVVDEESLRKNEEERGKSDDEAGEEIETRSLNEELTYRDEDSPLKPDLKSKRSSYFKENLSEHFPRESGARKSSRRSSLLEVQHKRDENEGKHHTKSAKSRLSLRRSKITENDTSRNGTQYSSEESAYLKSGTLLKSKPFPKESGVTQEEHSPNRSVTKLRQSLRKTKNSLEDGDKIERTQSLSEESNNFQRSGESNSCDENEEGTYSPKEFDIRISSRRNSKNISPDKSFTDSRLSLRKSKINGNKKRSLSGEELSPIISTTESKRESIRKSKCSLNACCGDETLSKPQRNDSVTKLRESLTKTANSLVKTPNRSITRLSRHEQSVQEKTEANSSDSNRIKSRQSFRNSEGGDVAELEQMKMRDSSSEDSLHLELSGSPSQVLNGSSGKSPRRSFARSKLTTRKSKNEEAGQNRESLLASDVVSPDNSENLDMSSEDSWHLNLSETESLKSSLNEDLSPTRSSPNKRRSYRSKATSSRLSSLGKTRTSNIGSELQPSTDTSSPANTSTKRTPSLRRSSIRPSITMNEDSLSSSLAGNLPVSPEPIINDEILQLSSGDESIHSVDDRRTPRLGRSSVRKSHLSTMSQSPERDDESELETSRNKSTSSRSSRHRTSLTGSTKNVSVITVSDSVDCTPENNASVIILDTPFEKTRKHMQTHKKLSKTLNSTIRDEVESATPKSAIRSCRSKSLPYRPVTEDVTPASPLDKSKSDSGFKTPLNTPGLFENIRKSVLKSRRVSRSRRSSSSNLMEELNKVELQTNKAEKRARESGGDVSAARCSKRRKVMEARTDDSFVTDPEDLDSSFESFRTEDALSDISDQNFCPPTPQYFGDLTDKPVINVPKTRSTPDTRTHEPLRFESQTTATSTNSQTNVIISGTTEEFESEDFSSEGSDSIFEDSDIRLAGVDKKVTSPTKIEKSPKNDLSDVAGLKKLLRTPKSPKNDLTNVPNLRKLMSPKSANSPKNDLDDIVGFKKLFSTPKQQKSPKNDLTQVANLRRLMSPKKRKSPKNDLSDVAGLKKLLSTPKMAKSPENDLRKVPNLRRLMSPKNQYSPVNDLSDFAGVKKLLSTPRSQNSPTNDLTGVPNLRRIMSPKQQNSPRNDLTQVRGLKRLMKTPGKEKGPVNDLSNVEGVASVFNVSGVHRLSNESDIENNENLFDKLFAKRPLRTYRGRSLSPTSRKAMLYDKPRKTLGDAPLTSPRVEKWVEEQAVMKSQNGDENGVFESVQETRVVTPQSLAKDGEDSSRRNKKNVPKRTLRKHKQVKKLLVENMEDKAAESLRRSPRGKRNMTEPVDILDGMDTLAVEIVQLEGSVAGVAGKGAKRKASKKVEKPIVTDQEVYKNELEDKQEERTFRKRNKAKTTSDENKENKATKLPKKSSRRNVDDTAEKKVVNNIEKLVEMGQLEGAVGVTTRGARRKPPKKVEKPIETVQEVYNDDIGDNEGRSTRRKRKNAKTTLDEKSISKNSENSTVVDNTDRHAVEIVQLEGASKSGTTRGTKKRKAVNNKVENAIVKVQEKCIDEIGNKAEAKVNSSRKRGRPKKTQQTRKDDQVAEVHSTTVTPDSVSKERTAKRVNFQKYGSDFVTESPKVGTKSKRKVHFMESEVTAGEGIDNKRHAGRKMDECVPTIRRSKRTRK